MPASQPPAFSQDLEINAKFCECARGAWRPIESRSIAIGSSIAGCAQSRARGRACPPCGLRIRWILISPIPGSSSRRNRRCPSSPGKTSTPGAGLPFIVHQGCKIVQIDIPKSGGLLESKKIADLADIFDIPGAAHNAIGPLGAIASAHCCAAIRDFKAHELALSPSLGRDAGKIHELPWGTLRGRSIRDMGKVVLHDGPLVKDGRIQCPTSPV